MPLMTDHPQFEASLSQMLQKRFSPPILTLPSDIPALTPEQSLCFRHTVRILTDRRAVLLCEPTGTGKSFIAATLAVYCIQNGIANSVIIVAPAHLSSVWHNVMQRFHQPFIFYSYQAASLDHIPDTGTHALFILDEAHYLKNAHTRRYRHLRRILHTKYICLISATPISMGYRDLESLMRLCGLPSKCTPSHVILRLFSMALMPRFFGHPLSLDMLSIAQNHHIYPVQYIPSLSVENILERIQTTVWPIFSEAGKTHSTLIPRLLIHRFLSHPFSCRLTLRKLRRYYTQCLKTGGLRPVSRSEFRTLFGLDGIQLPLPFGIPNDHPPQADTLTLLAQVNASLAEILSSLDDLLSLEDPILHALRDILDASPQPTIIFTQYSDTAQYIAKRLKTHYATACLTASEATLNGYAIDRQCIQSMFDPDVQHPTPWLSDAIPVPHILVATDTLATGHNLQRASCLIHLDTPWNPTTLRQREGRILRHHQSAKTVTFYRLEVQNLQALYDYQNTFRSRFEARLTLQETWLNTANLPGQQTYLFSNVKHNPGFWVLWDHFWLPIFPFCRTFSSPQTSEVHLSPQPLISALQTQSHPDEVFARSLITALRLYRFHQDLPTYLKNIQKILELTYIWPQLLPSDHPTTSEPSHIIASLSAIPDPAGLHETAWCIAQ